MTDDEYLQSVINAVSLVADAIPEYIVGVKNKDSEHVYVSPYFAKLTGFQANSSDRKVSLWQHYDYLTLRADELAIMNQRKTKNFLVIDKFGDELVPRVFVKRPLINPFSDNPIGTFYQAFDYMQFNLSNEIAKLFSGNKVNYPQVSDEPNKLSVRQKQVIFFFLANLNSQEIADFISAIDKKPIAKSTIDSIFSEQLYSKFAVVSRVALRQKLLSLGYDKMIPKDLIIPLISETNSCVLL